MTIESSPILQDRKHLVRRIGEDKQIENYILIEPSEVITMRLPYDARAELDRVEDSLEWSLNAGPIFNFRAGTTEEEVVRVTAWYDARLAEIARAEQQYRQRLAEAVKTGAIDPSECNKILFDLKTPFPTNPFVKAKREAGELYRKESKF